MEDTPTNDHDLLIGVAKTIELEFKNVKDQIKEIKDGTSDKIGDLYAKYEALEKWKTEHEQANKDYSKSNGNWLKAMTGIGIFFFLLIGGLLLWHITGGSGGYHI